MRALRRDFGHYASGWALPTVTIVRNVPWWGVVSSAAAPLMLVSGWTIATRLQPPSFDPVTDTVSALAALDAADRWVMTLTFLLVSCCDVITGLALRPAGAVGRLILVAGSAAGTLVAVNPQPPGGGSLPHATWASVGFVALAAWPGGAWRQGPSVPWALRPAVCAGAVAVLLALLACFGAELVTGAGQAGLAELVLGVAQAVWPLMVVLSCRRPVRTAAGSPICAASTSERGRPGLEHGIKAGIDAQHHPRAA